MRASSQSVDTVSLADAAERLIDVCLGDDAPAPDANSLPPEQGAESTPEQRPESVFDTATFIRRLVAQLDWSAPDSEHNFVRCLDVVVAHLDKILERQVNSILHHPRFQELEAGWRGVRYLYDQIRFGERIRDQDGREVKILLRVLSATKAELHRDVKRALDFDQTRIWKLIYEAEFGQAGGRPYGLLLGNYEFENHPEDLPLLEAMATTAAAAFVPFVAAASPKLVGLDTFERLEHRLDLSHLDGPDYIRLQSLRRHPDSRFLGLALPRVLMRLPYDGERVVTSTSFRFSEDVSRPGGSDYLWGNAAFAFGSVVVRAFAESGWFADIRGFARGELSGGVVIDLPLHSYRTDREGVALKSSTDVILDEFQDIRLSAQGLIPISSIHENGLSVFYSNQSLHKPQGSDDPDRKANEQISAMLQYVLCTSRFAHYLKVLGRRLVGDSKDADKIQSDLMGWIQQYVSPVDQADPEVRARYPLREAEVEIEENAENPGDYSLIMRLRPHYQFDELRASVRLDTRLRGVDQQTG